MMNNKYLDSKKIHIIWAQIILVFSVVFAIINFNSGWVQSDYVLHLSRSIKNGVEINLFSDILNSINTSYTFDGRARYLSYLVIAIDQKIRLHFTLPPSASPLLWGIHLLGVYLYFVFLKMRLDIVSAYLASAVYISSLGFLYVFTMNWLPTKALINFEFIILLLQMQNLDIKINKNSLLIHAPVKFIGILATIFVMLITDEYGFFGPFLLILIYWHRFKRISNIIVLVIPFVLFILTVLIAVPFIIKTQNGSSFSFFDTITKNIAHNWSIKNLFDLFKNPFLNILNQIGVVFVPYSFYGLDPLYPAHYGIQNIKLLHYLVAFFIASILLLRGSILILLVHFSFIIFISSLAAAHEPRLINGYYYGGPMAVTFSMLIGHIRNFKPYLFIFTFWIVTVQVLNFYYLDSIWANGSDVYLSSQYGSRIPIKNDYNFDIKEIREIAQSSAIGGLDIYLDSKGVPARFFYTVFEECVVNINSSKKCPELLDWAKEIRGSP